MKTLSCLKDIIRGKVVVIGLGNPVRGDDAAGPLISEALSGSTGVSVINAGLSLENYIQPIIRLQPETVLIIDSTRFSPFPGEVRLFHVGEVKEYGLSTHGLSPALFMECLEEAGISNLYLIGIQPENTSFGAEISEAVQASIIRTTSVLKRHLDLGAAAV